MKSHWLSAFAAAVLVLPSVVYGQYVDNKGTDFIMAFLPNHTESTAVQVHLTSDVNTNVTVEYPVNSPTFTTTVAGGPGSVTIVTLPASVGYGNTVRFNGNNKAS